MKQLTQRKSRPSSSTPGAAAPAAEHGPGNAATISAVAKSGTSGAGAAFPYADQIQKSFGGYDISALRAHTGDEAAESAETLSAAAFAFGSDVAFSSTPDLFTAAHEAAHAVCQSAGVGPSGEMGADGDSHEQLADAVAERVVAGKSASDLIDGAVGATSGDKETRRPIPVRSVSAMSKVQRRPLPEKQVSGTAMKRLGLSRRAIDHTTGVMAQGRGNQYSDLKATNFNSYFRMAAMRDPECWYIAPQVMHLARAFPDALTHAKAGLAKSGNCGEYAAVAMDWLRVNAGGEQLNYSVKEGLDHAFVVMGDLGGDKDSDLVVADAWPTAPTACLWEDFFAYTSNRSQLQARRTLFGDGEDVAAVIATGLRLTPKGQAWVNHSFDEKQTGEELKKGTEGDKPWIWRHENTTGRGRDYDYVGPEEVGPDEEISLPDPEVLEESAPEVSGPELVDLNSASARDLAALPGIGATLAQRIVEYRDRNGAFRAVDELRRITGISGRRVSAIADLVRV
jgi:competence ComEA-like helix-hairpin-helix protein